MNEKRIYQLDDLEVRDAVDGQPAQIVGHAAVFNSLSVDMGGFVELIEPGAFRESLNNGPDVRATIDHEGGLTTLGRTKAGTLMLAEDARGLQVRITPPDTQAGRDIMTLMRRGDINQMSFVFRAIEQQWERRQDDLPLRRLKKVSIDDGDVSIVTYPAYKDTEVSVEARNKAKELADTPRADTAVDNLADEQQRQARLEARKRQLELEKLR